MLAVIIPALIGAPEVVHAASAIDKNYVRSLAAPRKTILVVEYFDGAQTSVGRKGYATSRGFQAVSPTDIKVDDRTQLHLYGLEPCQGEMVNAKEGFAGSCADFARQQLAVLMKSPKVLYCRAFVSEQNAPVQDVTCYGYYNFPRSLDTVDSLEEQLLSVGALKLAKKADGSVMRPDLAAAEKIGRGGFGMWADPRVQGQ
ncbi:hypothetical protein DEM27_24470 [Metarhizobium album]|uniref:Uncharacterized protein n=1 Tax=Metarhizobium album TaxID=2182425 RepID=A0A2U2DKJ7_9HYPH|nr:hypothetical protein DEM27_24470 [Rhizobium album]